ncbi:MAG: hypothetical protein JW892_01150 [Anaerolineae bacterium]|nr:hypothetical protein [Anaerolineae bacterium]
MWLIVSLLLILPLIAEAVVTTFVLMVMLNGYTGLPDTLVNIYLASAAALIPGLALGAGFAAQKWAASRSIPLWTSCSLSGLVVLVLYPPFLIVLTFGLLAVFGML